MLAYRRFATAMLGAAAAAGISLFSWPAAAATCSQGSECTSTFCVDGFCCDTACADPCTACSTAKKGSGEDGICGFIADGQDPDLECPAQTCDAGVVTKAQVCDGNGACRSNGTSACDPYPCANASCGAACQADTECAATGYCLSGLCVADLAQGAQCERNEQCPSGVCVDGVCCDKACTGSCEACTAALKGAGADGACEPVVEGKDPKAACEPDPGYPTNCLADGACDGAGACRAAAKQGTACGATSCNAGSVVGQICDGSGACGNSGADCAPYACDAQLGACRSDCLDAADCAPGFYCSAAGKCQTLKPIGSYCSDGKDCESGFCVDSVCCESACDGQCEACDLYPAGKCAGVYGSPHGTRAPCPGQNGQCGASCDATALDCVFPNNTDCGSTCSGGYETTRRCDGNGTCSQSPSVACGAYQCVGSSCAKSCSSGYECVGGYGCVSGVCAAGTAMCTSDGLGVIPVQGGSYSCSPYTCWNGACRTMCVDDTDCADKFVCESSKCVAPTAKKQLSPGVAETDGCAMGRGRSGAWVLVLLLLSLAKLSPRFRA